MKAGKVWGDTELVHANGVLEFHRINFIEGGVCSKHKMSLNGMVFLLKKVR